MSVSQLNIRLWGQHPDLGYLMLGAFGIFLIGFLDDLARLSPKAKLIGEFLIAGLVVWGGIFHLLRLKSLVSKL